jgi:hypothetical protein
MPKELIKIVCTAVVLIKEGDTIVGESTSEPIACYSSDDLIDFFLRVRREVQEQNVAEKPNRSTRRKNAPS